MTAGNQIAHQIDVAEYPEARIVIVDDEKVFAQAIQQLLISAGYRHVAAVTDPFQVLDFCRSFQPNLVLLDLIMPGRDGIEVLRDINECPELKELISVIIVTGSESAHLRQAAFAARASDYISKPPETTELFMRIGNQLRAHRLTCSLNDEVRRRTAELVRTQMEVVERLAAAIEMRDDETALHTTRVPTLCAILAETLGLAQPEISLIRRASPLHDVGKLAIPDAILLKPGRLTAEEFEIMKAHTTMGARLLSGSASPLIQMAEQIALSHHERWDGTGYPEGRRGEDIPQVARIVAVADVFDALTHVRPYKEAWPLDKAVVEIRNGWGTQFDPRVVEAFLEIHHEERLGADFLEGVCR